MSDWFWAAAGALFFIAMFVLIFQPF